MAGVTLPLLLPGFGVHAQGRALVSRPQGGFRFLPGSPVFAGGGVAEPGFAIVHAVLARWIPLVEGYGAVERHLEGAGRPMQALCGLQLRLPRQLSAQEFSDFNAPYVEQLQRWGVVADRLNPVSRTNVSPAADAPETPSLHAFSFTVPYEGDLKTFTMSGMVERGPGGAIAAEIPGALAALAAKGARSIAHGVRQHFGRPPVVGLELELEARAVLREETVPA
jgi:hypothetical protein